MELKINIIEAAAEIAEGRVRSHYEKLLVGDPSDEELIGQLDRLVYQEDGAGGTIYTENAQGLFNLFYDMIFEKLIDCKVTPVPNLFNSMHLFIEDAVEQLANQKVERHFKQKYKGQSKEDIASMTWELGKLNEMNFSPEAQGVFDEAKVYYEMNLKQFEV